MASALDSSRGKEALSPRAARAHMDEAMGKLDLAEEEATPLLLDDGSK
jgi:hypothetical protein